jgi:hypothetical protein
MIPEYTFGGIYVASVPVTAALALLLALVLHRLLVAIGAYRWVWHPVLFDTAIFVIIWSLLICFPAHLAGILP